MYLVCLSQSLTILVNHHHHHRLFSFWVLSLMYLSSKIFELHHLFQTSVMRFLTYAFQFCIFPGVQQILVVQSSAPWHLSRRLVLRYSNYKPKLKPTWHDKFADYSKTISNSVSDMEYLVLLDTTPTPTVYNAFLTAKFYRWLAAVV